MVALEVTAAAAAVAAVVVSAEAGVHEGRRVQPRWQGRGGAHCSCTPSPPCTAGTGLSGRPAVLRSPAHCAQRCSSCLHGGTSSRPSGWRNDCLAVHSLPQRCPPAIQSPAAIPSPPPSSSRSDVAIDDAATIRTNLPEPSERFSRLTLALEKKAAYSGGARSQA